MKGTTDPPIITTYEPAHPEVVVAQARSLTPAEVRVALATATEHQREWEASAAARSSALDGWAQAVLDEAEPLSHLVAREVGKPIREARGEVYRAISILRYYAQAAFDPTGEIYPGADERYGLEVRRRPLGTVLLITPWNFPIAIPAWKIAPALAYGNTVLFRPSSSAVGAASRFVELSRPAVPESVMQLVVAPPESVESLLDDPRVAGVSFTGSAAVGTTIVRRIAARGGTVQAEMGGQNASVVLADADLEFAATTIADAAMGYAGQKCTATSRVIVLRAVADRFVPLLVDRVRGLAVGDPTDESNVVGPVISQSAREAVAKAVAGATQRGARLLTGAEAPSQPGWFYRPTLVEVADPDDPFVQEETFGPAAAVLIAESEDEAIRLANGTRYGLSAAVFGANVGHAEAVAVRLDAGLIRVNASTAGVDFYAPFGGERASSYGPREQGRAAKEFYTRTRTILIHRP